MGVRLGCAEPHDSVVPEDGTNRAYCAPVGDKSSFEDAGITAQAELGRPAIH
jgi:hypothetical protein